MGKIISIIGSKGGAGKTTLSHMVAHGLGLFGKHAAAILTDTYRDKLSKIGRAYVPVDARRPESLMKVVEGIAAARAWFGVIDGGGNRPEMDERLAAMSDLVILPFRESHEDIRALIRDLERFPGAWAVPSQWPTNRWAEAAAQRGVNQLLGAWSHRILAPVYALGASKLLLQDTVSLPLPAALNNASREIALQVLELLGIEIADDRWLNVRNSLMTPAASQPLAAGPAIGVAEAVAEPV